MVMSDLDALLAEAEAELLDWCTGERSWTNEIMNAEPGFENRPQTLALIEARDADAIRAARERVEGLRTLRSVQVPVTEEWLEEHVIGVLDDESHEDVCSCGEWPESCVTYGVRRPWSHDASRAIEYIARNFTVLPSPGTTTEEE